MDTATWDLKIVGGMVVDGTGSDPRRADVAVKDGQIVAVGECPGEATETIDAAGAIVTPGFVDLHTHYDGQVSWDEEMAPSCFHGVTTAVMGNCGVGFAPCRAADRDRLIALMQGVEDIPGTALSEGLTWDWESFPEYMDAIDSKPHTLDFAMHVPHDALRVYVMGDRAVADKPANAEEIAEMRALVREAIEAGAVGFSTGRSDNHRAVDGSFTPSSEATVQELVGIAEGLKIRLLEPRSPFVRASCLRHHWRR
ncbi:MAG: N-acyl-D-aspartate/D-glutamate deacylase, partial [Myxococcota bacterium]